MSPRFIYVFCKEAKEKLVEDGFHLITEDKKNSLYIFQNNGRFPPDGWDYAYCLTDDLVL